MDRENRKKNKNKNKKTEMNTKKTPRRARRGRKEKSLAGTHLYRHPETGYLYWRRTDPQTGRRDPRPTNTDVLEDALKVAQDFEEEWRKKKAGIKTYGDWRKPLEPLVDEFLAHQRVQNDAPSEGWLKQKKEALRTALSLLKLTKAADLTDLGRIDQAMRTLDKPEATKRRRIQDPLKQFSAWLAGNQRHLDRDPLVSWEPIHYEAHEIHRALLPLEVARALVASEWLDTIHGRAHRMRTVFTILLVTMPRASALASRVVADYLRTDRRINFGEGNKRKGRGQGWLDDPTAAELEAYLGDRRAGPLVQSPEGGRIWPRNLLRWWQEAFSLGLVWEMWPKEQPWNVEQAFLVSAALLSGRVSVRQGGNPKVVTRETRIARKKQEAEIAVLVDELSLRWAERMERVTVHCFRHTHETWAVAAGVDQVLINLQGGWKVSRTKEDFDVKRIRASMTGLNRYLDPAAQTDLPPRRAVLLAEGI
jgi:integrase